jgi:hypothetical protein
VSNVEGDDSTADGIDDGATVAGDPGATAPVHPEHDGTEVGAA